MTWKAADVQLRKHNRPQQIAETNKYKRIGLLSESGSCKVVMIGCNSDLEGCHPDRAGRPP